MTDESYHRPGDKFKAASAGGQVEVQWRLLDRGGTEVAVKIGRMDCAIDAHWYINEPAMPVFCCADCVPSFLRYASYQWEQWGKSALRFAFSVWYHASGAPFNHRGEWFRRPSLYASCKSQCESSPWSLGATSSDDCYCRNHWYRPLPWYGSFIGTGRTIEHVVVL